MNQATPSTPEWVKNAIFYQIFPDRFASSTRVIKPHNLEAWDAPPSVYGFKGGDLLGVLEHLDYLQELGITALYFNPIFQSASSHRYHTHDYYQVDPLLGGNPAFSELLTEAHRRGMRVVLDGVFNHASRGFFQFNHILECGKASPYIDWFTVYGYPLHAYEGKANYKCWVNLPALPEFNFNNPQVRQYILDIARFWLEQGIDGWRLDVPFCIDDDRFWQDFRQVVKTANPEAYIVGEVPWEAQRWLQGDQFDAVMNYQFTQAILGFAGGNHIDHTIEKGMMGLPATAVHDAASFAQRTLALLTIYPKENAYAQFNLLDSHDMPRFKAMTHSDPSALRLAIAFQMTYPGAPCVYYGDEVGLAGGKSESPEPSRQAFPWEQSQWDMDLLNYYKKWIGFRKEFPALRTGEYLPFYAQGSLLGYLRRLGEQSLVIFLNANQADYSGDIPTGNHLSEGSSWRNVLTNQVVRHNQGRLVGLELPVRTATILIQE